MQQLACSNSAVYSVDVAGQTYIRLGIDARNAHGSNWRKIPGVMKKLAGNHCVTSLLDQLVQQWQEYECISSCQFLVLTNGRLMSSTIVTLLSKY